MARMEGGMAGLAPWIRQWNLQSLFISQSSVCERMKLRTAAISSLDCIKTIKSVCVGGGVPVFDG